MAVSNRIVSTNFIQDEAQRRGLRSSATTLRNPHPGIRTSRHRPGNQPDRAPRRRGRARAHRMEEDQVHARPGRRRLRRHGSQRHQVRALRRARQPLRRRSGADRLAPRRPLHLPRKHPRDHRQPPPSQILHGSTGQSGSRPDRFDTEAVTILADRGRFDPERPRAKPKRQEAKRQEDRRPPARRGKASSGPAQRVSSLTNLRSIRRGIKGRASPSHSKSARHVLVITRRQHKSVLFRAGLLIAAIAVVDWLLVNEMPLGFLYILPMLMVGRVLRPWLIAVRCPALHGPGRALRSVYLALAAGISSRHSLLLVVLLCRIVCL